MKEYIILVAVSAIFAAFADILAPKEWQGYIKVLTGFLIMAVLLSPVAKLKNIELFSMDESFEVSEAPIKNRVFSELKINIEKDIERRILSEFGEVANAEVSLDIDEERKMQGVKYIGVEIENVPAGLTERLKEIYGCESVEFRYK